VPELEQALRRTTGAGGGTGAEGPLHKLIKEAIAADPVAVLGEPGLKTIQMEYPFPTGDRADVMLEDSAGRIIGLEVEPAVGDDDLPGILQAIKYRYMGALMRNKRVSDSRSFLVANHISAGARRICEAYQVECFEVDPAKLKPSR